MALKPTPQFKPVDMKLFEIPQPAIGGLNLKDLEYEQEVNQSPYMMNMMYRNGSFSKRYGQDLFLKNDGEIGDLPNEIYAIAYYKGEIIAHSGTKIYKIAFDGTSIEELQVTLESVKGLFFNFNGFLYYIQPPTDNFGGKYWQYDGTTFEEVKPYSPDVYINMQPNVEPSPTEDNGDVVEDYNLIGDAFKNTFHGDGTSKKYYLSIRGDDLASTTPKVWIGVEEDDYIVPETDYTFDKAQGLITFDTAPAQGTNNVIIELYMSAEKNQEYKERIYKCKYPIAFGGNNNSRLFLAGGGDSLYYFSEVSDATYFPETSFAKVGNSEDDITGFGLQYNVLIIFKPREIYSLTYYLETDSDGNETGRFQSQVVNARVGCDCPHTIQLISNQLTWFNTIYGVCTLTSTNIVDERNVKQISRNIDRTNNMGIKGILDFKEDKETIQSVDFDSKYFLVFPESGMCYMWDYAISPYAISSTKTTNPKELDWFLFDKFYVKQFLNVEDKLIYLPSNRFNKNIVILNDSFIDLDFDDDGHDDPIDAFYMTPFYQFNAVEYLKTVKNIYVQTRGDTASVIDMYYYTENNSLGGGEIEPESIRIGGKIWNHFSWDNFQWLMIAWANTFVRKCSLKKVQMASFLFKNNEANRDMSISHISLQYQIVKYVK